MEQVVNTLHIDNIIHKFYTGVFVYFYKILFNLNRIKLISGLFKNLSGINPVKDYNNDGSEEHLFIPRILFLYSSSVQQCGYVILHLVYSLQVVPTFLRGRKGLYFKVCIHSLDDPDSLFVPAERTKHQPRWRCPIFQMAQQSPLRNLHSCLKDSP